MTGGVFNAADWLVVGLFVGIMLAIVLYSMRVRARSGQDYFLLGRDTNWVQNRTACVEWWPAR